ncbi:MULTISPECIES: non-ribosomal peptide synthetase [unclassified Streptomyces]|uniref:non-ribosomal peptide synthetase n=1 Tax=unclassified Streptomyces TaxID=2593676 RepID=UPI0011E74E75|nr:non-ribosomal peptide synthetase [Streptomyces sp. sk2.1]TXS61447.1 amino acid adenylation domain-containing protein [Streptomyces sp. sk2.1]
MKAQGSAMLTAPERTDPSSTGLPETPPTPVVRAWFVHERFAAFAASSPGGIAIEDSRHRLSYRQALDWADALADRLRAEGVGPEQVVGIHLDRSAEAVVTMLAVLRCGAAYLALPPEYPEDRLRFMVRDSGARVVVTGDAGLPAGLADLAVAVPVGRPETSPRPASAIAPAVVRPANLAYVIYTSGTTGLPKGVGVTHANVANLVGEAQRYVRFGADETFLQLSPLAFDPSAVEIWGALAHGSRLVIAAPSYSAVDELPSVLAEKRITTLGLTPPLFHSIIEKRPEALDGIRQIMVGGDILSAAKSRVYVDRAVGRGVPATLMNVYGPTECATFVSAQSMAEVPAETTRVPVGPPIAGAGLYLLDEELRPVGLGEHGEVYIGGKPVTRGYLDRPGLTAERFLPDPFGTEPGARMYATGDEGVLDERGVVAVIGRLDRQVKVRGHRIELSELEHTLRLHPDVRDACVLLADAGSPREQLVAHIAVAPGAADDVTARLAAHAAAALPAYMCPGRYVVHQQLPLTHTGKVDRKLLAEWTDTGPAAGSTGGGTPSEPLTAAEELLTAIWRKNFESEAIGPDDDFSALGGTSILAIGIVADAQDAGLPLTLVMHYKNPTVRRAAAALATASDRGTSDE